MMLARLEEMERTYRASSSAAHAMWCALIDAEGDEVVATMFDGSPKLKEIERLRRKVETVCDRLAGAHEALSKLTNQEHYNRGKLETIGLFAKWRWEMAVSSAQSQTA